LNGEQAGGQEDIYDSGHQSGGGSLCGIRRYGAAYSIGLLKIIQTI
jgi:hypothetical protein